MKNNYFGSIQEESRLLDLVITINGEEVPSQNISDLQLNFGKNNLGLLSFMDITGISELAPLSYGIVEIYYSDLANFQYFGKFIIKKLYTTRYKEGTIKQVCYLEGFYQNTLKNLYVSKTFKDKTMPEMLEIIFNEYEIPTTILKTGNDKIHDYFVFPGNMSFWDFMNKHFQYENMDWFFSKNGLNIMNRDYLSGSYIEFNEEIYTYEAKPQSQFENILEFYGVTSNNEELITIGVNNIHKFDSNSLKYSDDIIGTANANEYEKINLYAGMAETTIPDIYAPIGIREFDTLKNSQILGREEDFRNIIRENQKFSILIQGLNTEKLFHKIQISLPRPKGIDDSNNDKCFSGMFIVTEVIDKIISGVFTQVLVLQAADYLRGDESVWK